MEGKKKIWNPKEMSLRPKDGTADGEA